MIYLSDAYIFDLLDTLKSEYFLVSSLAILIIGVVAKKTKTTWDDTVYDWLKKRLGK